MLIELPCLLKYAEFSRKEGSQDLGSISILLFSDYCAELEGALMKPVTLAVIVVSTNHISKTVTHSDRGAYNKGQDKDLLMWLLVAASRHSNKANPGSLIEMICN